MIEPDDLSVDWTKTLCSRALADDYLAAALLVIQELHSAMGQGRPVNPHYGEMLAQMLTAADVCVVNGILISAAWNKNGG